MAKFLFLMAFLPALVISSWVRAQEEPYYPGFGGGAGCVTNENATISLQINGNEDDVEAISAGLKAKTEEIKTLARDEHFTKFTVQQSNYNIRSSNFNRMDGLGTDDKKPTQYHYTGNITLNMQPADKALHFMKVLTGKGYRANINVSSYNSGNCQQ